MVKYHLNYKRQYTGKSSLISLSKNCTGKYRLSYLPEDD